VRDERGAASPTDRKIIIFSEDFKRFLARNFSIRMLNTLLKISLQFPMKRTDVGGEHR
jgi:hypothetical protein